VFRRGSLGESTKFESKPVKIPKEATVIVLLNLVLVGHALAGGQPNVMRDLRYSALHFELTQITVDLNNNSTTLDIRVSGIVAPLKLEEVTTRIAVLRTVFFDANGYVWGMEALGFAPILSRYNYSMLVTSETNMIKVVEPRLLVSRVAQRKYSRTKPIRLNYVLFDDVAALEVEVKESRRVDCAGRGEVSVVWVEKKRGRESK
jgi:hypothetical protein